MGDINNKKDDRCRLGVEEESDIRGRITTRWRIREKGYTKVRERETDENNVMYVADSFMMLKRVEGWRI